MDAKPVALLKDEGDYWVSATMLDAQEVAVSVLVPCFNAHATLERAVHSALGQTLRDIEVIIVDDASTDESWSITERLMAEDGRVRSIRNKQNCGKPVGMNRAMAKARGRWIAVLDADDWFAVNRLATLVELGERRGADMVADNQFFYDCRADTLVGTAWTPSDRITEWRMDFDAYLSGSDAYDTFNFGMLKPMIRAAFIARTGLAYEPVARNGQDFLYLLHFFQQGGKAAICDRPLYAYTQPFGTISRHWSHEARRRYDFRTAHVLNCRYLEQVRTTLTRSQAARLEARNRKLLCLEHFHILKEQLGARRPMQALALLMRNPRILSYVWRSLQRRYLGRSGSSVVEDVSARARRASGA